jgi:hypothetical protein
VSAAKSANQAERNSNGTLHQRDDTIAAQAETIAQRDQELDVLRRGGNETY